MGRKLFVGNFPYETGEAELQELFARAGTVETVKVMRDMTTGRARGFSVFGPAAAAAILRDAAKPFADNGVMGATATLSRRRGGSDHTSFNEAGLPGIGVQQDPIEYQSYTWHTNLDTYERVIEDDVKQAAIVPL